MQGMRPQVQPCLESCQSCRSSLRSWRSCEQSKTGSSAGMDRLSLVRSAPSISAIPIMY